MSYPYADRINKLKVSFVREMSKLMDNPDIISFAGGSPSAELFPIEEMKQVCIKVLNEDGKRALQYGATDGFLPLREKIVDRLKKTAKIEGITSKNIIITSGSQQGIDISGKLFLNPGDTVVCESPSFLGAINAFATYECNFIDIPMEDDGMIMEDLENVLQNNPKVKFIYVIPDFQNPSGRTWSVEKRKQLVEIANRYNKVIVEDNPYYELRYENEIPPSIKSFDTNDRVIFLGTFSKIFAPGIRIGWVCAHEELIGKYNLVKQGADLHVSSISQRDMNTYIEMFDLDKHIETLNLSYRKKRDLMLDRIRISFPDGVKVIRPEGGLFLWVELPEHINTTELVKIAIAKNVAYVPGENFYANGGGQNTLRLNFTSSSEDQIIEGIEILAAVIREAI